MSYSDCKVCKHPNFHPFHQIQCPTGPTQQAELAKSVKIFRETHHNTGPLEAKRDEVGSWKIRKADVTQQTRTNTDNCGTCSWILTAVMITGIATAFFGHILFGCALFLGGLFGCGILNNDNDATEDRWPVRIAPDYKT